MSLHETAALRYWRELNSTLDVMGAKEPASFDDAYAAWERGDDIDETAVWLFEKQRDATAKAKADEADADRNDFIWRARPRRFRYASVPR